MVPRNVRKRLTGNKLKDNRNHAKVDHGANNPPILARNKQGKLVAVWSERKKKNKKVLVCPFCIICPVEGSFWQNNLYLHFLN